MADEDSRLQEAQEVLLRLANGEYEARATPSSARDALDAVLVGINMLAETLAAEREGRIAAEGLLQDERAGYDASPGLAASVDLEHHILACNQTFAEKVGESKAAILGRPLYDFHPPPFEGRLRAHLEAAAADATPDPLELRLRSSPDAKAAPREVILEARPAPSVTGAPARLRLLYRDVSEERRLERQIRQAQKMDAIGRLAGGIAHDFNNVLTVIQSTVAVALAEVTDESLRSDLGDIDLAAKRAADMTGQLLSFSRRQLVEPRRTDVNAILTRLERLLRRSLGDAIRLNSFHSPDLPDVLVDPVELEQVVLNLVINARDAMPDGGTVTVETARVIVDLRATGEVLDLPPGPYIQIAVSDTGHGMPPEVVERVFEPFFTTKPPGRGTGLGLSTCFGIVRQAGGTIHCYSEPSHGTVFKVYLPILPESAPGPSVDLPRLALSEAPAPRVLVVENDDMVRAVARRVLRAAGYQVEAVPSTEAARRAAEKEPFALLITDAVLGDGLGRELAVELAARGRIERALFVSGYTENSIVHQGVVEAGVSFLRKPFTPDQLLARVRDVIEKPSDPR